MNSLNTNVFLLTTLFTSSKTLIFFKPSSLNDVRCFLPSSSYVSSLLKVKLSTVSYYPQSLDLYAYQSDWVKQSVTCVSIYINKIFSNLTIFFLGGLGTLLNLPKPSAESIFYNFWWLEREVSELSNVTFSSKSDVRNLLLEYSNVTKPLLREFPSVGLFELYFDFIYQVVVQLYNSVQF